MIRKLKNLGHLLEAIIANIVNGFPGRKITIVGVTGTDGKTTTTSIISHILNSAGRKTAMITTVGAYIDGKMQDTGFHVTTPSAFAIQKFLRQAVISGQEFAVIETSSHGIDQNRIWGIPYKVAAITNITHEHLDYHGTFQDYAETKFRFLSSALACVLNMDDKTVTSFQPRLRNKVITYSRNQSADYNLQNYPYESRLFGSFNQSNALAAIACCKELGLSDEQIRSGLATFTAPAGRQQIVWDQEFKVMVDFAHTPNSIENLLREAKKTNPKRLVHLFGAPGRRDQAKRPLMGQASARYADIVIVAPDDPRDEKISDINTQVKSGIGNNFIAGKNLFEFDDRHKAIEFAFNKALPGDFIVLTGKGHEPTLALADGEVPWNEGKIVQEILNKNKKTPER
jgi:UDP-N-acetylmuramoyl-L-alanyl-D-glutamate--2,6-diaminopimelate ligase